MRVKALTIVALLLTTAAYGQVGGDPPYLLENGWKPLLNGNDLGGWVGENGKPHEWITRRPSGGIPQQLRKCSAPKLPRAVES